jgi:hypothetical protein
LRYAPPHDPSALPSPYCLARRAHLPSLRAAGRAARHVWECRFAFARAKALGTPTLAMRTARARCPFAWDRGVIRALAPRTRPALIRAAP